MSEASRALAGMEILTIEYENCVLKCAGKGLQFKLQVSSLWPRPWPRRHGSARAGARFSRRRR